MNIQELRSKYHAKEIAETTANTWLKAGAIRVTWYGNENTYYVDQFDAEFYCKNYPQQYGEPAAV